MLLLQPLDVCLNKLFKGYMRKSWNDRMTKGEKTLTVAGNLKRPSIPAVMRWVKPVCMVPDNI